MNTCGTEHTMDIHLLLGALIVLCNTVSAYIVVKTRSNGNAKAPR